MSDSPGASGAGLVTVRNATERHQEERAARSNAAFGGGPLLSRWDKMGQLGQLAETNATLRDDTTGRCGQQPPTADYRTWPLPIGAHSVIEAIVILAVLYLLFHHRNYRRHRRAGLTVRESIPGPFRTWISVSRRFRQ